MKLIAILGLIISLISFAQVAEIKETPLEVAIGIDEIVKLDYKFNTKVSVGDQSKLRLILSPAKQEITFRGVKPGKTSVTIRDGSGDIRDKYIVTVTSDGKSNVVRELRDLLGEVEGIEIGIKGGKVVLEGAIVVPDDIGRIATVLAAYPDVLPLIEMSKQTQRIIARKMQDEINRNSMKDVRVRVVNKDYWLEGVVNSAAKKELATEIAQGLIPGNIQSLARAQGGERFRETEVGELVNHIAVNEKKDPAPPPKLIKVTSQFVELTKDYQKIFAFQWNPLMNQSGSISFGKSEEGGIVTKSDGTLSGTISNLFPKLSSAKSAGYARVIQSGMIVTQENQEATINKTREIPIQVGSGEFAQADKTTLTYTMKVTPSVGEGENVFLRGLSVTVALPGSDASGGQPTSIQNSITTNLVVKSKESAAIGGIVQNSSSTNYDKNLPSGGTSGVSGDEEGSSVLFNLLRSKGYNTSKSQFVVFITPEVVQSAATGTEEIRKKFRKRQR
tara:strand:+ start:4732 stop:6240 length:1509 start_codon:yes stop_codon:yes gene_type:complete